MNSETSTRYGSRVRRHGRSRAARDHHARSLRVNACPFAGVRARGVDERAMHPQDTAHGKRGGANAKPATAGRALEPPLVRPRRPLQDRKSTRLNSSHSSISYAVFCLKKKIKYRP